MDFTKAWLDYKPIKEERFEIAWFHPVLLAEGEVAQTALKEYITAFSDILGTEISPVSEEESEVGVYLEVKEKKSDSCNPESYGIYKEDESYILSGCSENALLQAVFEFERLVYCDQLDQLPIERTPVMPLRMANHWDNMDGEIERGYSGQSFFFQDYQVQMNDRIRCYTRLMASIGINAIVINNVNVHEKETYLITDTYLDDMKQYAEVFREYGIQLFLSVNFAAPMELAGLSVSDPLDPDVIQWWEKAVKHVYEKIPYFGGFLVKADSEGRPGPFTYGRTHADGANMLARALAPYHGILIWRCFVYNCGQDWRDRKTDRARAAYDHFMPLDGEFDDNVILQIKNGPMDFQIREPVSPLFGALKKTNTMLEVQIAQEYTGQQIDICYLVPMWKEILDFDTYQNGAGTTVSKVVSGQISPMRYCGMAGVMNTGDSVNWTGNDMAGANLYGFGRLCMNPDLSAEQIADEWICMAISTKDTVRNKFGQLLLHSREVYENYNAPLGIGWMVTPHYHYGPDIDGYEYDRWGTYHRADHKGLGVDRTPGGTGYTTQYAKPWCDLYAKKETCPMELLLFFHYVPYDYILPNQKTLIQHIYDTHFEGVSQVEEMIRTVESLKEDIPKRIYACVRERLDLQLQNAKEWRDRVNTYFYRKSGIDDEYHRTIY